MHVFYIHSHITYVMAKLFIAEHKLLSEEVKFITSRRYALREESITLDITGFYNYLEQVSKLNKLFNLNRRIKTLDAQINLLVNNDAFTVYVPQFNHSIFQILSSHKLCEYTVLIEEGITAYKFDKSLYLPTKTGLSQFLSSRISKRFVLKNNHYRPFPLAKFKYAITVNENGFPFIENKKIVAINREAIAEYAPVVEDGDLVFVLDSFMERTKISEKEYYVIIKTTLDLLKSKNKKLLVKFHPEQNDEIRKKTLSYIEHLSKFESVVCLNDSVILELEFLKSKKLMVIGMHTSLLYYAESFGHKVLSSIKTTSKNPKINHYIDHIMDKDQKKRYMSYE